MSLALFVYLAAVAWLASCAAGALLGKLWRARGAGHDVHPWALHAPRLLFAIPFVGFFAALTSLLPARLWTWLTGLCACEAFGGVHVCPFHFRDAAGLLLYALPIAVALLLGRLRSVAAIVQRSRDLEHLASAEQPRPDGVVPVDHGGKPAVFVVGLRSPRIVVDPAWWDGLSPRERAAIAAHEKVHVEGRDPLVVSALELLLRLVAPAACARIVRDWTLASELRADAAAAKHDGDPTYVAEVLCRHARTAAAPGGALGLGGPELAARVRQLLEGGSPENTPFPRSLCVCGVAFICIGGNMAHRAFEALLMLLQ